jgi:hypothetical protein
MYDLISDMIMITNKFREINAHPKDKNRALRDMKNNGKMPRMQNLKEN